jgi:tRNA(Ile)-lysidine synthase
VRSALSGRVLRQIQALNFVHAGDRVAVAVSGGADSVALLHLLLELRGKLGIVLSVAHFNHKIRGRASDADEKFVAKLAGKHNLPFHVARADVAARAKRDKANLEDTARRARYAFLDQLVSHGLATKIAVAHTADDQAETVLAHILRGTGLTGLGGIHPISGNAFRPLLQSRRDDLRAHLRAIKQPWREDASNRDTARTRARIRKELIPFLEKHFQPAVVPHLASLADLAREDEAFLDAVVRARLASVVTRADRCVRIATSDLLPFPESRAVSRAFGQRALRNLIEELKPRTGQLNAQHVRSVLDLAERSENGKCLPLPGGIEARRENDALILRVQELETAATKAERAPKEFAYNIDLPVDLSVGDVVVHVPCLKSAFRFSLIDWPEQRRETSAIRSVLDRDALRLPLVLRNWRVGDRFCPAGHRSPHKMKRLLNRRRIARWDRDGWPVLTSGGVLAWARGFPVAAEFAASERTQVGIVIAEEKVS